MLVRISSVDTGLQGSRKCERCFLHATTLSISNAESMRFDTLFISMGVDFEFAR